MEQRREVPVYEARDLPVYEADVASFGVLLGVVAAAFIALGVIIYFFGEDQSSMTAANTPPAQTERMVKKQNTPTAPAEPSTVGQRQ